MVFDESSDPVCLSGKGTGVAMVALEPRRETLITRALFGAVIEQGVWK